MAILTHLFSRFDIKNASNLDSSLLKSKLRQFYDQTDDYTDFHSSVSKDRFLSTLLEHLITCENSPVKVLEFGAGRTQFPVSFRAARSDLEFHTQDITTQNSEYLEQCSTQQHIEPLLSIRERFDLIFSTFVWEHVPDPEETLQHLLSLVRPGGSLFIACPVYDFPGYLSPSSQNRSAFERFALRGLLCLARLQSFISRKPQFLIDTRPALFDQAWSRDTDAIHWVSRLDFKYFRAPEFTLTFHKVPNTGYFRDWIWSRFLVVFVEYQRRGASEI